MVDNVTAASVYANPRPAGRAGAAGPQREAADRPLRRGERGAVERHGAEETAARAGILADRPAAGHPCLPAVRVAPAGA